MKRVQYQAGVAGSDRNVILSFLVGLASFALLDASVAGSDGPQSDPPVLAGTSY